MNLNLTVNEAAPACPAPPPTPPGLWHVRARYVGLADAGHLYGPFARAQAEACAVALAGRANVKSATLEPATGG